MRKQTLVALSKSSTPSVTFFAAALLSLVALAPSLSGAEGGPAAQPVAAVDSAAPHQSPFPDDYDAIEPARWRAVQLALDLPRGGRCEVSLLRPLPWLEREGATVGGAVYLDMPEMGLRGEARVLDIGPCPELAPAAPGSRTVTGIFVTTQTPVLDLFVEGLAEPLGVTASHPLWSLDRSAWTPAGELLPGERLGALDGSARVLGASPRERPETVYNLEVHRDHTYYVSEAKLWAHNTCQAPDLKTLQFTDGALRGMGKAAGESIKHEVRHVPRSVVESILEHGTRVPDPQGVANTFKFTTQIWANGRYRHAEAVWNATTNTVYHVEIH